MTQQPLVSIITPAFKAQHSIADTVRSVLAQRYRHWEMLIVSDDHYDYRSKLKAQGLWDKRISLHYSEQPQSGPNAARNIALNAAQGELIAPLDADDSYYPERLSTLSPLAIEYGMAADNADIVSTEPQFGQQLGSALVSFDGTRLWSARAYCETNTPLIFVFRRDVIHQPYNPNVILGEDTLFNLRAMQHSAAIALHGQPLHQYSIDGGSICHQPGAADNAQIAYDYCLAALKRGDNLGFHNHYFESLVHAMLSRKRQLNAEYREKQQQGFNGSFQHFISEFHPPRTPWMGDDA